MKPSEIFLWVSSFLEKIIIFESNNDNNDDNDDDNDDGNDDDNDDDGVNDDDKVIRVSDSK